MKLVATNKVHDYKNSNLQTFYVMEAELCKEYLKFIWLKETLL